jgi:hypothetical protein
VKTDSRRVPPDQAAAELGMSKQGMREYMKRGLIDIGVVLPAANGGKCHTYHIYRDKLDRHLGKISGQDSGAAGSSRDNMQAE